MAKSLELQVQELYVGYLGRAAELGGLTFWVNGINAGTFTLADVAREFTASSEYTTKYEGLTTVQFVAQVYQNVLGRAADADGLTFWSNLVETGAVTEGNLVATMIGNLGAVDQLNFDNRTAAAQEYTVSAGTNYDISKAIEVVGGSGSTSTFTLTNGVDNIVGTSGNDVVIAALSEAAGSSTFQAGDVINGGTGEDTLRIVATNTTAAAAVVPSLSGVENIEYQGFGAHTGNALNLATSTGVNSVSLVNGNTSLTVNNVASLVAAGASNTTGGTLTVNYNAATVAGTADVQNVSLNNTASTIVNVGGVETVNIAATGTNTAAQVQAAAATTVNVSGAGSLVLANALNATTTTFNASANTGGVTASFTAGGNVTATGGSGNDTFNFGTGLTATAGAVAGDVVNGGEGTDTVRVDLAGAVTNIPGGTPGTDTDARSDISAAAGAAPFNALISIERVAFDGTEGVTINGATFTNAGITNIEFNTAGAAAVGSALTTGNDIINNAGSARTYEFGTANAGSATFALAAGATALNIGLMGTAGTAAANDGTDADIGGLTITTAGVASTTTPVTVSLTSAGDLADGFWGTGTFAEAEVNQTGLITVASGSTFNVDGDGNLAIFGGAAGTVSEGFDNNVTLNLSAFTGNTILAGSSFDTGSVGVGLASTGTNGVNTPLTEGIDSFTLGAGRDVIVFADGLASGVIQIATPAGGTAAANAAANGNILVDTITGFQAGANGDMLFFGPNLASAVAANDHTAIQAATQTAINALSGSGATLQGAADLAAADAAAAWTAFSFQGQTYALYDADNTGSVFTNDDILVHLVGVNVADLTDANFAV